MEKNKKEIKLALLEKAFLLFEEQKRAKSLTFRQIVNSVFKDVNKPSEDKIAQFWADFMASGLFVYCGDNAKGEQVWDLKARKSVAILDKSSYDLEFLDPDDEEARAHELKDGIDDEDDILTKALNQEEDEEDNLDEFDDELDDSLGDVPEDFSDGTNTLDDDEFLDDSDIDNE